MKKLGPTLSLLILLIAFQAPLMAKPDPITKIAKANAAREKAKEAYLSAKYEEAINYYSILIDSLEVNDEAAILNRANAYYHTKDTIQALDEYRSLSDSKNKEIASKAFLQLGVISEESKEYESALEFYKEAIKADYKNEKARYNYELLKKKLEQQKNQDQQQQQQDQQDKEQQKQENKDQQQQDQNSKQQQEQKNKEEKQQGEENQEQQNQKNQQQQQEQNKQGDKKDAEQKGEQEGKQDEQQKKGEEQSEQQKQDAKSDAEKDKNAEQQKMSQSLREKLKQMNMSKEKAEMILKALQQNEAQYFQQLRKKAKEYPDPDKPDW